MSTDIREIHAPALERYLREHADDVARMQAHMPRLPDGSIDMDAVYAAADALMEADPDADVPKRGRPPALPSTSRHVRLPTVLWAAIEQRAQATGARSTNAAVRAALEAWVQQPLR